MFDIIYLAPERAQGRLKKEKINLKKLLTNEKQSVIINNRCGRKVKQQRSSLKIED
jgi:hypothetical protein